MRNYFFVYIFLPFLICGSIQSAERFIGTDQEHVRTFGFRNANLFVQGVEAAGSVGKRKLDLLYNGQSVLPLDVACPYNNGVPGVTYASFADDRKVLIFAQSILQDNTGFVATIDGKKVESDHQFHNGLQTSIALVQERSSKEALKEIETKLDFPSGSMKKAYRYFLMEEIAKTGLFGFGSASLGTLGIRSFVSSKASLRRRKAALVAYGSGASYLADQAKLHGTIARDLYRFFDTSAINN